jgi:NitT/TauT family transport system permease protein
MPLPAATPLAEERALERAKTTRHPHAARDRRLRLVALRVALLAVLLLIWQVGAIGSPAFVLPSPARVFEAWSTLVVSKGFWRDFGITFWRVLTGFALATAVGVPLGLLLGANEKLGEFFEPVLTIINTVSSTIWAIFALIWFGLSDWTTIFVVFMTAMPLILTNVWQGTRTVNADFIELAQTFRMSRLKVMQKIYLPTILPPFFSAARLAFGFGARVSLVAETLGASSGIGYRLRQAADLVQTDQVFAWTLTLVALMIALEALVLKPIENRLFAWKKKAGGQ